MKKSISLISISLLLIFIVGCTIIQPVQQPSPTETVDVKKKQKREAKKQQRDVRSRAKNRVVEQKTNQTQAVATTTTKPVVKVYKLKVTLSDIQCLYARDGRGESDDYGIQQYVVYKALGKENKFISRDINKFKNRINLGGQVQGIKNMLINGDKNNQIHVREDNFIEMRNRSMINSTFASSN